jgi:cyclophilin family peptidyl-prolyl cis-trans isomerase
MFFTAVSLTVFVIAASSQQQPAPSSAPAAAPAFVADKDMTAELAHTALGTPERPIAVIQTTEGTFRCVLFKNEAPETVANFIGLAFGSKDWTDPATGMVKHHVPLYTATIFHRVIPNFMIQGGDPLGSGMGDPGYKFKDEFSDELQFDRPGRLAMANSGPDTNGSQFFITEVPTPHLNGKHTIFGQCDNVDLVEKIAREPRDPRDDKPENPVGIIKIGFEGVEPPPPPKATPTKKATPGTKSTTKTKPKTQQQ